MADTVDWESFTHDMFEAVGEIPNQHVEIIDRLDKTNELLERIATATEQKIANDALERESGKTDELLERIALAVEFRLMCMEGAPEELAEVSPALARMLKEGRVR